MLLMIQVDRLGIAPLIAEAQIILQNFPEKIKQAVLLPEC